MSAGAGTPVGAGATVLGGGSSSGGGSGGGGGATRPPPGAVKPRVGYHGMEHTNDGIMRMSIE